ncbi:flavin reductase family protein [Corynebacterium freiburgense]|uniref:flavin reductase family protein n=1 Tax=Corynebacterium freiburgense TaxID=556548 RepID=UPI00041F9BA7|nr:flavin reductase family protein [Corynebacterium freiburgense]WJZ03206.1 p-hydroxyphenylacetate 3-hydroxylase, reductase component [Corynebacterium freiburgense]
MKTTLDAPTSTHYRQTVANFPSGVTVVTTHADGEDIGLTVSAFASLSLEPPMVLVSIDKKSRSHEFLGIGAPIGISVLAAHHTDIAVQFARHGHDRFAGVALERKGCIPIIAKSAAWFRGQVTDRFRGGDHIILTIAVKECDFQEGVHPLLYQNGRLHSWPESLS